MPGKMELVTVIVQRRDGKKATTAALQAGATGVTSYCARGTGVRQRLGLLGKLIQAEKEVILVAAERGTARAILDAINVAVGLEEPGKGFAFVQDLEHVVTWFGNPDA